MTFRPRALLAGLLVAAAGPVCRVGASAAEMHAEAAAAAVAAAADTVLVLSRPAVVALYVVPPDSLLAADDGLASLLDDFLYYWADSRPRLERLGVEPLDQPVDWRERAVRVRLDGQERRFTLRPDSADVRGAVGYLLAAPGREPRLLHGVMVDEELEDSARVYFGRADEGR